MKKDQQDFGTRSSELGYVLECKKKDRTLRPPPARCQEREQRRAQELEATNRLPCITRRPTAFRQTTRTKQKEKTLDVARIELAAFSICCLQGRCEADALCERLSLVSLLPCRMILWNLHHCAKRPVCCRQGGSFEGDYEVEVRFAFEGER